ncbi:unnamed protein product [Auanema sp. JU1783]|nr:unnamed protein product [Auanema sp. JU1783]
MTEEKDFADKAGGSDSQHEDYGKESSVSNPIIVEKNETVEVITLDKGENTDIEDDDETKQSDDEKGNEEDADLSKKVSDNGEDESDNERKSDGSEDEVSESNDEPIIMEGKRKRIQVERLSFASPVANSPSRVSLIGFGSGKPLGSFPHIENSINKIHSLQLKLLHRLLYTYTSKMNLIKREIRLFNGFPFDPLSKDYQKKVDFLNRLNQADLKVMKQVLGMKSRVKKDLIDELLSFLCEPDEKKFHVNKKRHTTPKSSSEPKAKRTKVSAKESESNDSTEEYTSDEEHEKGEEVVLKFKSRAKDKKNVSTSPEKSDSTKTKQTPKSETTRVKSSQKSETLKVKTLGKNDTAKAKSTPKPETNKGKSSMRSQTAEEKISETPKRNNSETPKGKNQTSKKRKNICNDSNPTDEMIVSMIRELLKDADLTISMRQMINTLHECFPNASFEGRKAFLKEKVINVVQE